MALEEDSALPSNSVSVSIHKFDVRCEERERLTSIYLETTEANRQGSESVDVGVNIDADVEVLKNGRLDRSLRYPQCDAQNPVLADGVQEHPRVLARERRFSDGGQGGGDAGFERRASGGVGGVR